MDKKTKNILIGASVIAVAAIMYWYFRKRKFTPTQESLSEEIEIIVKD